MSQNKYIDIGQEQDCHNDLFVITNIKSKIVDVIKDCQLMQQKGALAYYEDTMLDVVDALDDVVAITIKKVEDMAEEGASYYENNR